MTLTRAQRERKRAVEILLENCENWSEGYTAEDFLLDRIIRDFLKIPQKKLGSPPYRDWVKLG